MASRVLVCIALAGAVACAEASTSTDAATGDDSDAAGVPVPDAAPAPDAPPTPDAALPDAVPSPCGNNVIDELESCDDGDTDAGDGCSATCAIEPFFRCESEPSICSRISILYAPSENDDPAYRSAIAAITGGLVDYLDARASTPTLSTLQTYDCVYTWVNGTYADPVVFGDTVADYVDADGTAVLGVFSTYTTGNSLGGRIMTAGYSPVVSTAPGTNHFGVSAYAGDGTTFLHDSVTAYSCEFRDFLTLQGTGVQDGSYADGEIAHAYRPDFKVVYSNGSGDVSLGCAGDWARLIANACAASYLAP